MSKFLIKRTDTGFNFKLIANNGQPIGSSEIYATKQSCKNGINSVINNAAMAEIEDHTSDDYQKTSHPKFEVFTDKSAKCRFRLKAKNGSIILVSQAYTTKASCMNGVQSVINSAAEASIEEAD